MAKKEKEVVTNTPQDATVDLAKLLSTKPPFTGFSIWLVGDTPLITHAWSHKAKLEMLQKQVKSIRGQGKDARDPEQDFIDSLYDLGDGSYGFPVTGVKLCILSAAHKDKGIPRDTVMRSLWLEAQMVRVRPALAGAICDMPLVRIYGEKPVKREDMVKIGSGLNKTANLAYRGQFTVWGMKITGRFNSAVLSAEKLIYLINESGQGAGLGEWRNERKGIFGAFHMGSPSEANEWEKYVAGKGPLPVPAHLQQIAAE